MQVILTDIEGTISDIAFVRDVLFPYARRALPDFVSSHAADPAVRAQLDAAADDAGLDRSNVGAIADQLCQWIDEDRKVTPLKALQGMIWRSGYADGDFTGHLYPDAHAQLKAWRHQGTAIYVYSSGSVEAQKLYFRYSDYGDIEGWFDGFFDTNIGHKREVDSYRAIVDAIGVAAGAITFYSDVTEELDAAAEAGMKTVWVDRYESTQTSKHRRITSFAVD